MLRTAGQQLILNIAPNIAHADEAGQAEVRPRHCPLLLTLHRALQLFLQRIGAQLLQPRLQLPRLPPALTCELWWSLALPRTSVKLAGTLRRYPKP